MDSDPGGRCLHKGASQTLFRQFRPTTQPTIWYVLYDLRGLAVPGCLVSYFYKKECQETYFTFDWKPTMFSAFSPPSPRHVSERCNSTDGFGRR